jgi:hypothetical protein
MVEGLKVSDTESLIQSGQVVGLKTMELWSAEVERAIQLTRQWAVERRTCPGLSLVLSGRPGLGKTHMARAALWSEAYFVDDQPVSPTGKFYLANDLLLRLSPNAEMGITATVKSLVGGSTLIVVDDVGHNLSLPFVSTEWQEDERHARIHAFVDYCHANQVSLILTSRLEPKLALGNWLGRHSWDRLLQMARQPFIVQIEEKQSFRVREGMWKR